MRIRAFLAGVNFLPWTPDVADIYGDLRAQCEAGGIPLALLDMMIAAHAKTLATNASHVDDMAILITRDRAYWRVPGGLTLEDWNQ